MAEPTRSDLPFYLRGIHAPVDREVESFELPVEGPIPPEIDGLFVRNGPNPAKGDPGHWFLGDGMLHGVRFERGRPAWYRNRFVRTRALAGEARYIGPDGSVDFTAGVANTHVVAHAGRILALVENGFPWEVDGDLETVGCHDFDGRLEGPMTAHPKICAETGELLAFGYSAFEPYLRYLRVSADDARETVDEARQDLERFDRVLGSAEAIGDAVGSTVARGAFSSPSIKAAGLARGASRTVARLRRKSPPQRNVIDVNRHAGELASEPRRKRA